MTRRIATALLFLAAVILAVPHSHAATIVNDTWLDGTDSDPASPTYSENGVDTDTDGDLESAWFQGGAGTLDPAGAGGPLRMILDGGPTGTSSSSWTTYFTPEGSEATLANVGDRLRVTWVFTTADVNTSNGSQNFRVALVDSPGTARLSANGAPGSAAYAGYAVFGNMGETFGHSNPFELFERTNAAASSALLSATGSWEDDNLAAIGGTNGNAGFSDNTQYTFLMELTRLPMDQINVAASIRGGNLDGVGLVSASGVDVDPAGFSFDTFSLRPSSAATTATQFDTSLFRVEFVPVPEPASALLGGLAGLMILGGRRRR